MMMSRREIAMETKRDEMLNELISKYGFESEPVLYFGRCAEKDMYNIKVYFTTALNWHF